MLIVFDRGERFLGEVKPVWLERRQRLYRDWSHQIDNILDDEWQKRRPLQAADLLAWSVRRYQLSQHFPSADNDRQRALSRMLETVLSVRHYPTVYDYDKIMRERPVVG